MSHIPIRADYHTTRPINLRGGGASKQRRRENKEKVGKKKRSGLEANFGSLFQLPSRIHANQKWVGESRASPDEDAIALDATGSVLVDVVETEEIVWVDGFVVEDVIWRTLELLACFLFFLAPVAPSGGCGKKKEKEQK